MGLIVKIFSDRAHYAHALEVTKLIANTYQKSQSMLYILTKQIQPERPMRRQQKLHDPFEHVGLRYGIGPEVLSDINFTLAPGSFHF